MSESLTNNPFSRARTTLLVGTLLVSSCSAGAESRQTPEVPAGPNIVPGVTCYSAVARDMGADLVAITVEVHTDPDIDRSKLGVTVQDPREGAFAVDDDIIFDAYDMQRPLNLTPVVVDINGKLDNVHCPAATLR